MAHTRCRRWISRGASCRRECSGRSLGGRDWTLWEIRILGLVEIVVNVDVIDDSIDR